MNRTALPLAVLTLIAFAPPVTGQDETADVSIIVFLHENPLHIGPDRIDAKVGDTIDLKVINTGVSPHDLVICGDAQTHSEKCTERWGYTALAGGEEGVLRFTAAREGTFEYFCTIPGHKTGGMRGELFVHAAAKKGIPWAGVGVMLVALAAAGIATRRT